MDLTRINDVVESFGISSRTLRYYGQVGIIWSSHPFNKAQRYYDSAALERLKQVIVLRKMQIPIKNIIGIFNNESMTSLIQAFVDKLDSLDNEITALSELRSVVNDFLQKMLLKGTRKISAITLLYEETEKRIPASKDKDLLSFERLSKINREALKLHDVRLIRLPPARMLTSRLRSGELAGLDGGMMQNLFAEYGLIPQPGMRNCFYMKLPGDEWMMLMKIPDSFDNKTIYEDTRFPGGLYAIASSFMEDLDDTFMLLRDWTERNENFGPDTDENRIPLRDEMIEEILPWDIAVELNRYQQDVFIPIRSRKNDTG